MTKERKDTITVCSAVAMLSFGCVLTTIAFFIAPMGIIDDSVLWVLGQCFIYAGSALGIATYARGVAKHEVDERMSEYERHHRHHRLQGVGDEDEFNYEKPVDDEDTEDGL